MTGTTTQHQTDQAIPLILEQLGATREEMAKLRELVERLVRIEERQISVDRQIAQQQQDSRANEQRIRDVESKIAWFTGGIAALSAIAALVLALLAYNANEQIDRVKDLDSRIRAIEQAKK